MVLRLMLTISYIVIINMHFLCKNHPLTHISNYIIIIACEQLLQRFDNSCVLWAVHALVCVRLCTIYDTFISHRVIYFNWQSVCVCVCACVHACTIVWKPWIHVSNFVTLKSHDHRLLASFISNLLSWNFSHVASKMMHHNALL